MKYYLLLIDLLRLLKTVNEGWRISRRGWPHLKTIDSSCMTAKALNMETSTILTQWQNSSRNEGITRILRNSYMQFGACQLSELTWVTWQATYRLCFQIPNSDAGQRLMETGMEEFLQKKNEILGNGRKQIPTSASILICTSSNDFCIYKVRYAHYCNRIRLLGKREKLQFRRCWIESEGRPEGAVHSTYSTTNQGEEYPTYRCGRWVCCHVTCCSN